MTYGKDWESLFYAQSCLLLPCIVAFLFMPEKYTDVEEALQLRLKQEEQNKQIENLDTAAEEKALDIY